MRRACRLGFSCVFVRQAGYWHRLNGECLLLERREFAFQSFGDLRPKFFDLRRRRGEPNSVEQFILFLLQLLNELPLGMLRSELFQDHVFPLANEAFDFIRQTMRPFDRCEINSASDCQHLSPTSPLLSFQFLDVLSQTFRLLHQRGDSQVVQRQLLSLSLHQFPNMRGFRCLDLFDLAINSALNAFSPMVLFSDCECHKQFPYVALHPACAARDFELGLPVVRQSEGTRPVKVEPFGEAFSRQGRREKVREHPQGFLKSSSRRRTLMPCYDQRLPASGPPDRHTGNARVRDAQGAQQSGYCRTERERSLEQPGPKGNAQISPNQQIRTGRILFPVLASKR